MLLRNAQLGRDKLIVGEEVKKEEEKFRLPAGAQLADALLLQGDLGQYVGQLLSGVLLLLERIGRLISSPRFPRRRDVVAGRFARPAKFLPSLLTFVHRGNMQLGFDQRIMKISAWNQFFSIVIPVVFYFLKNKSLGNATIRSIYLGAMITNRVIVTCFFPFLVIKFFVRDIYILFIFRGSIIP